MMKKRDIWDVKTIRMALDACDDDKLLRKWKESQERAKAFFGDDYFDYGLVIAMKNGRPCEDRKVNAQCFDAGFCTKPNLRETEKQIQALKQSVLDAAKLIVPLQERPELAAVLSGLLNSRTP